MCKVKRISLLSFVYLMAALMLLTPISCLTALAEETATEEPTLEELYNAYKDVPKGSYTDESYDALTAALETAKQAIYGEELLKNQENWYVVKPGVGTPISQSDFAAGNYGYDFPIVFTQESEYLNMVLTSHGLYENGSTNWQGRQNYYILDNCIDIDFSADKLDFKYAMYRKAAKWANIQPVTVLYFENIGTVYLEEKTDRYMTDGAAGIGRVYSGNIVFSELENYMSEEQKSTLAANGNKDTLTRIDLYHNPNGLNSTYDATEIWGIDIYKFNVTFSDSYKESAYSALTAAVDGLELDYQLMLESLYSQYADTEQGIYTGESYKALTAALNTAKQALSVSDLTVGGSYYYHRPKSLSFIDENTFKTDYPDYADNLPWIVSTASENGQEFLELKLNNDAFGFYYTDKWGQIMLRYDFATPIDIDFSSDILNIDIKFLDDSHANETGQVYLLFEGAGYFAVTYSGLYGSDFAGGENVRTLDLSAVTVSDSSLSSYLAENGNKTKLVGVAYYNSSAWGGNSTSHPSPRINVYGFTRCSSDTAKKNAYDTLKAAVDGLTADPEREAVLPELLSLYNEYINVSSVKYTPESYAALQKALEIAKAAMAETTVDSEIVTDTAKFLMPGKMSTGELLKFTTVEEFRNKYPDDALPFLFDKTDEYIKIGFNKESIGFCHSLDENGNTVAYWGLAMTKYDLSSSPVEVNFNNDSFTVDIQWTNEDATSQSLGGSVSLFFANIGEWIELSTVANSSIAGRYQATVDLSEYYNRLAESSAEKDIDAKNYLDGNGGVDFLTGIVFRFADINNSNNNVSIYVRDFTINKKYSLTGAMNILTEAVNNLENAVNGDVDGDGYINSADLIALRKALLGIDGYTAIDVNLDTSIDIRDLICLKRYLAEHG